MNYWTAGAAIVCLSISSTLLLAGLSWMVNRQQHRLPLAYLLALIALAVLQSLEFVYHSTDLFQHWPFFLKLADPVVVMIPFCIYGYIRALQGQNVLARSRRHRWTHALPVLLVAALAVPFWSLPPEQKIYWMLAGRRNHDLWEPITLYGNPYLAIIGALSLFYWWQQRHQGIQSRRSAVIEWVGNLQTFQLLIALSIAIRLALFYLFDIRISLTFVLAPATAYLTYLLLTRINLPVAQAPPLATAAKAPVTKATTKEMPASAKNEKNDDAHAVFQLLENAMREELFRENDLTLGRLATHCGVTTHQASAAINQCSGHHFYDWINGFRLEAAAQALTDTRHPVTRICHDVGFNAKSTFNTAFKRRFHTTPTAYRKQYDPVKKE